MVACKGCDGSEGIDVVYGDFSSLCICRDIDGDKAISEEDGKVNIVFNTIAIFEIDSNSCKCHSYECT